MSETMLPRRRLGRSALEVNTIGMGCAPLGELFVRVDDAAAQAALQAAWSGGVRYFDTAPEYGFGLSEHRVGQFLRQRPRNEFVLSTKVGRLLHAPHEVSKYRKTFWTGGLDFDFRFDYGYDAVMRSVEDSYQRLGLNRVDVLLIHDLDVFTHGSQLQVDAYLHQLLTGGWRALTELRGSGVIGAIGAGLNDAGTILRLLESADLDFILLAMRYTLLEQDTLDVELPRCAEKGVGLVIGGVFNSGITATGRAGGVLHYAPAALKSCSASSSRSCLPAPQCRSASGSPAVPTWPSVGGCGDTGRVQCHAGRAKLAHFCQPIPAEFWAELKAEKLIRSDAPVPA